MTIFDKFKKSGPSEEMMTLVGAEYPANEFIPATSAADGGLVPLMETEDGEQAVLGRDLWEFLEIGAEYAKWFKRMEEYGFVAGQDFIVTFGDNSGTTGRGRKTMNHIITLDMAKELSMIQRTEKGKQARLYFIECEKRAKAIPALPGRAELAQWVIEAEAKVDALEAARLRDRPKVELADEFLAVDDAMSVQAAAHALRGAGADTGRNRLFSKMLEWGWIARHESGQGYKPYQYSLEREWLVSEPRWYFSDLGECVFTAPRILVTPKGLGRLATRFDVVVDPAECGFRGVSAPVDD